MASKWIINLDKAKQTKSNKHKPNETHYSDSSKTTTQLPKKPQIASQIHLENQTKYTKFYKFRVD